MEEPLARTKREPSPIKLLKAVELEINGRLRQSLHNAVRLSRGMKRQYRAISLPWQAVWYQPQKPPELLPAGMSVLDVFYQAKRQLWILGETGSGKTTTMLGLAQDLLEIAKADDSQPIPVLVSLSSWKQPQVDLFKWLVAELRRRYGLRQDLGKAWIQNGTLLPLLDGLDEVPSELQHECVEEIDYWLTRTPENRPCGILICCRRREFEQIAKPLNLHGAIDLQPLTLVQIEDYFHRFGLQSAWQMVKEDAALQEFLTKPLFLSMFGLVQRQGKFEIAAWQTRATSKQKIEYLLDTYWDAVMSRELIFNSLKKKLGWSSRTYRTKPLPQQKAVRRMLVFVAKAMERDSTIGTEFLIENLRLYWLLNNSQKIVFYLLKIAMSGIVWGAFCLLIYSFISINKFTFKFLVGFSLGCVLETISICLYPRVSEEDFNQFQLIEIEQVGVFPVSINRQELFKEIRFHIRFFLEYGFKIWLLLLTCYVVAGIMYVANGNSLSEFLLILLFWLTFSFILDIFETFKLLFKNSPYEIIIKKNPNQGFKLSALNIIISRTIGLTLATIAALILKYVINHTALLLTIDFDKIPFLAIVYIFFFFCFNSVLGLDFKNRRIFIQHIVLRIVLKCYGYVPFRFDRLLDYCTERLLIQRIGGRYRFTHKLLQDHFAKMELD
ncbi:MAG: NACHT domain-containing protein [Geitlerinemataceae cyanobacterium]